MLMDVLENGEASPFFDFFDIDWQHPYESMRGKVLAPFLGGFYGECLENGEITLYLRSARARHSLFFFATPGQSGVLQEVLTQDVNSLRKRLGSRHLDFIKLSRRTLRAQKYPPKQESADRADQILFVKQMLWELTRVTLEIKEHLDANIARFNGIPGNRKVSVCSTGCCRNNTIACHFGSRGGGTGLSPVFQYQRINFIAG